MNADNQGFDWAHSKVVGRRFLDCDHFIRLSPWRLAFLGQP
jgi:hypothetical protein